MYPLELKLISVNYERVTRIDYLRILTISHSTLKHIYLSTMDSFYKINNLKALYNKSLNYKYKYIKLKKSCNRRYTNSY